MVVAALLLYRRCTGGVGSAQNNESGVVNTVGAKLVWGPFHIPGIWGIITNAFALIYMTIAVFFSFWPPTWQVTVTGMNFSAVGTFGVIVLGFVYYAVRARHVYNGPVVEVF